MKYMVLWVTLIYVAKWWQEFWLSGCVVYLQAKLNVSYFIKVEKKKILASNSFIYFSEERENKE